MGSEGEEHTGMAAGSVLLQSSGEHSCGQSSEGDPG